MRAALLLIAAAALALGACQRKAEPPVGVEEEPPAPAVAAKGATRVLPAAPVGAFDAISNTAMSITGGLTAGDGGLKFDQGQRYTITGQALAKGGDRFAASGATWSALMNVAEGAEVAIFRIATEDRGLSRNGGFCGQESATFLAMHRGVDRSGAPALFIAAFKGEQSPGPAGSEASLCGTFLYAPQNTPVTSPQK